MIKVIQEHSSEFYVWEIEIGKIIFVFMIFHVFGIFINVFKIHEIWNISWGMRFDE